MKLKHLDLFSGIGGFALGFQSAGKIETVAFCENDQYCRAVLKAHWPDIYCHADVYHIGGLSLPELERGGQTHRRLEPCLRPNWLVVENGYHRWRAWVPELRRQLWARGYASVPFRMRAAEMGAYHDRSRCFVVANPDSVKLRQFTRWWGGPGRAMAQELAISRDWSPGPVGTPNGISSRVDRCHALGNAILPQKAEIIGHGILAVERASLLSSLG